MRSRNLSEEQIAYLKEHFHNTSDEELAKAMGLSVYTIKSRRTKHGLRKDKEYIRKINSERARKYNNADRINTPEAYAKRAVTRAKLYEQEKIRIKWGLEQKTKRHFRTEPANKLNQRNRLKRQGYIIDEKNLIAYWTKETKRAPRLEAIPRGVKKGTIKPYYEFREWIG